MTCQLRLKTSQEMAHRMTLVCSWLALLPWSTDRGAGAGKQQLTRDMMRRKVRRVIAYVGDGIADHVLQNVRF